MPVDPGDPVDPVARPAGIRTLVLWCPDWPVVAAGGGEGTPPLAVVRANRVVAASPAARREGVRRGMRRREAESRCPGLELVPHDPARDTRAFEWLLTGIDALTPGVEVVRPGLCRFPTRGPSRYFGGDEALAARVLEVVDGRVVGGRVVGRVGVADGPFAATVAARQGGGIRVVPVGGSAAALAPLPVATLLLDEDDEHGARTEPADLVDLLVRLGITTLGSLAALPEADVVARFGRAGHRAWRLAGGSDEHPVVTRRPPPELVVQCEPDPPVARIDTAAFLARGLAEELTDRLTAHGLACTRIAIEAETAAGEVLVRRWRHERAGATGGLTPVALADRVRWQLDGWLLARRQGEDRRQEEDRLVDDGLDPSASARALTVLRLVPEEVVADEGRQLGLWGGSGAADERAARAFVRVQGLLGPEAVATVVPAGGRRPAEQVVLVPWGDAREVPADADRPWPGRVPGPRPTVVHPLPLPARVLDAEGQAVRVTGRGEASAAPVAVAVAAVPGGEPGSVEPVVGWAGPWPLEERWWDLQAARRQARLQVATADGRVRLVVLEGGGWWEEARWD